MKFIKTLFTVVLLTTMLSAENTGRIITFVTGKSLPHNFMKITYDGDKGYYQELQCYQVNNNSDTLRAWQDVDREYEPLIITPFKAQGSGVINGGYVFSPTSITLQMTLDTTVWFIATDTMKPVIELISPTASTPLILNVMDSIRVDIQDNSIKTAKWIYYFSSDNGANYTLIDSTIPQTANDSIALDHGIFNIKRYGYTPTVFSDQCKIKVEAFDVYGNMGVGYSETFSVIDTTKPTVSVTSPNGSEKWYVGTTHNITWTADDNVSVTARDIYYSSNNGTDWNKLDSVSGNTGSWPWTISCPPSNQYLVRVRVYDQSGNMQEDLSNAIFEIADTITIDTVKPTITITAPATDEIVPMGTTYNITWAANDNKGIASRAIKWYNGSIYQLLDSAAGNTGLWAWVIPNSVDLSQCKIMITVYDSTGNSKSDETGEFEIKDITPPAVDIKDPKKGQVYSIYCEIRFDASDTNGVASRSLWYSLDGGKNYTFIDSMLSNNPEFYYKSWAVHQIASHDCRVKLRVYDTRGNCNIAISDSFVIRDNLAPTITVTQPTDIVMAGSQRLIVWEASDFIGIDYILLELSTDSGATFSRLDSVKPDTSRYLWSVPANVEYPYCYIKAIAVDPTGNQTSDLSPRFSIFIPTLISYHPKAPKNFCVTATGNHFIVAMEKPDKVCISLYTLNGRKVWERNEVLSVGYHRIRRNRIAQGIYILRVSRTGKHLIQKIH